MIWHQKYLPRFYLQYALFLQPYWLYERNFGKCNHDPDRYHKFVSCRDYRDRE